MALRHLLAGLCLLPALMLAGCGQKGALYLPDQLPPSREAQPCRAPSCAAVQKPAPEKDKNSDESTEPTTLEETPE